MSPAEVFQEEDMTLTCKTEHYASERIRKDELIYTLDPPQTPQTRDRKGVFSRESLSFESNYTCVAEARGIRKRSKTLTVRPKSKLFQCFFQMQILTYSERIWAPPRNATHYIMALTILHVGLRPQAKISQMQALPSFTSDMVWTTV